MVYFFYDYWLDGKGSRLKGQGQSISGQIGFVERIIVKFIIHNANFYSKPVPCGSFMDFAEHAIIIQIADRGKWRIGRDDESTKAKGVSRKKVYRMVMSGWSACDGSLVMMMLC